MCTVYELEPQQKRMKLETILSKGFILVFYPFYKVLISVLGTRFNSTYQRSGFFDKRFHLPFVTSANRIILGPALCPRLTDG